MSFKEYYRHYLTLHRSRWCRRLHVFGQIATITFITLCVITQVWAALLLAPFVVYPFAWSGHFFFEKNKPAAWSKPLWAKACDWVMLKDILTGKIRW